MGAYWKPKHNAWRTNLCVKLPNRGTTTIFIGYFAEETDAARAYLESRTLYRNLHEEQPDLPFEQLTAILRAVGAAFGARPKKSRRSSYAGVTWDKRGKCWKVQIYVKENGKGRALYAGNFKDELSAAVAYQQAKLLWLQIGGWLT